MTLFDRFFKKDEKENESGHRERSNVGTRRETYAQWKEYWNARAAQWAKTPVNYNNLDESLRILSKNPFAHFTFSTESEARSALVEIPFIHEAVDSGKLISTEPYDFGYYLDPNDKRYHAVVGGVGLSHEAWTNIIQIFQKHGGSKEMGNVEPYKGE